MIKLICQKANGEKLDVTNLLTTITWSGDYKSCARKLEFSLISSANDINIPKVDIPLMSIISFYEDDNELFRGFLYEREKSSDNSMSFLCYDYCAKLNDIKVSYNIKNETASSIYNKFLTEYGLKKGDIVNTSTKIKKVFLGTTAYDMIMTAYTEEAKKTNKKYMVYSKGDKFCASEKGIVKLKLAFEEGKNILSSNFKESVSNMVNKVLIVDDNGNKVSEVKNDEWLKTYGLFQEVYKKQEDKDANAEAKAMLNGIEQSCSLSGFGDTTCITGYGVQVKDLHTGLVGLFFIDSDTHTWEGGKYTIDLELNFKNIMDEVSAGQDEQTENSSNSSSNSSSSNSNNSSSGSSSSSSSNSIGDKLVSLAKSKLGCKYVWGATGPNTFDCSGLTSWCYKQVGISIPRTSLAQSKSGKAVSKSNLQPGDLLFWKTTSAEVGHVGMYVGNGQFIHAPNKSKPVKYDSLSNSYYSSRFVRARRYY